MFHMCYLTFAASYNFKELLDYICQVHSDVSDSLLNGCNV